MKTFVDWPVVTFLVATGLWLSYGNSLAEQPAPPPVAVLKVQSPQQGAEVSGNLPIRVEVQQPPGASLPRRMFAGFGGPPWVELQKQDGVWVGEIDTTLVPNGSQNLRILTENRRVTATVGVTVNNPLRVWFADLHSHTSYSDGTYFPIDAYTYARNVAKLDVFCLTDHLESLDENEWIDTQEVAWKANELGKFTALIGLEWTKQWGHLCIYNPPTYRWPSDPEAFYRAAAEANAVLKFNHPGDGTISHGGLAYSELGDKVVQLMEVRNLAEEKAFRRALRLGWHLAPDGSTDTHSPNWGNVRTWTGILAPGLSVRNILDALANRRCFSTADRNCTVQFEVNGLPMGTIRSLPVEKVNVSLTISDPDASDTIGKVELYLDDEVAEVFEPQQANVNWRKELVLSPGPHYLWIKVTQTDNNSIWCAPVWITVRDLEQPPAQKPAPQP
ncbi:CehA/McbA family metallohydrolase [Thermogutta sp.]|uniref:CehA/McbA family metallohydrolase n=1 Tax=Thermogutta sp. TaxID=1962930 RepID=UPI003C7AECA1